MMFSRPVRPLLAVVCAVATVAAAPAASTDVEDEVRVVCDIGADGCGELTVTGAGSGLVRLDLAQSVTLATPVGTSPDLSVSTDGTFAGVVIAGTDSATAGVRVFGGLAPGVGAETVLMPILQNSFQSGTFAAYGASTTLPAGSYDLHLIADDAEATVTLRLGGFVGATTVEAGPSETRVDFPNVVSASGDTPAPNVASRNTTIDVDGSAIVVQLLALDFAVHGATQYSFCGTVPDQTPDPFLVGAACAALEGGHLYQDRLPAVDVTKLSVALHAPTSTAPAQVEYGYGFTSESVLTAERYLMVAIHP